MFINTLVRPDIVEDRKERLLVSQELEKAGVNEIFKKMEQLNHEHINLAIQKFREEIEVDAMQEDMETFFSMDPMSVLHSLLTLTQNTPSYDSLHHILCYLLKIQDNPEKSNYQFQLIEMLVQQVATDANNYSENASEFTVQSLIPKFSKEQYVEEEIYPRSPIGTITHNGKAS